MQLEVCASLIIQLQKKPSMHAGLTQKASRAFPDFCTMG